LPGVETFDEKRDARQFAGLNPVIAHPPCRLWTKTLSHQAKSQVPQEEKELGRACVRAVIKNGGVLEQPAGSKLFEDMSLPVPNQPADPFLFTLYIEQLWFGYPLKKPTWLLISGVPKSQIPEMPFHLGEPRANFDMMTTFQRSRTVKPLAEWLCAIARASWWQHL
jgi:hypothetical protein